MCVESYKPSYYNYESLLKKDHICYMYSSDRCNPLNCFKQVKRLWLLRLLHYRYSIFINIAKQKLRRSAHEQLQFSIAIVGLQRSFCRNLYITLCNICLYTATLEGNCGHYTLWKRLMAMHYKHHGLHAHNINRNSYQWNFKIVNTPLSTSRIIQC